MDGTVEELGTLVTEVIYGEMVEQTSRGTPKPSLLVRILKVLATIIIGVIVLTIASAQFWNGIPDVKMAGESSMNTIQNRSFVENGD